jgi:two-component sensor histidine kinase
MLSVGLLVLAALGARLALIGPDAGYPYLTFFIPVLISALMFGWRAACVALAAGTGLAAWLFVPPAGHWGPTKWNDLLAMAAFITGCSAIIWLAETSWRGWLRIEASNRALRDSEAQLLLMLAEMRHRIKNTLAVVISIADQTHRSTDSVEEFQTAFSERLRALGRAHDVLSQRGWSTAPLEELACQSIGPLGGAEGRISITGPPVEVPSARAVALGMALHELATNATKHGALSVPAGRVRLTWSEAAPAPDGRRWHELRWEECGGPPIPLPPTRRGLGTRLLERGLPSQLGGPVTLEFAATGLVCSIRLPEDG